MAQAKKPTVAPSFGASNADGAMFNLVSGKNGGASVTVAGGTGTGRIELDRAQVNALFKAVNASRREG